MSKIKLTGFTLSETLITLTIVGIVAILVVPGFIKGAADKSRMTLLHNTISNINNAVQNEMVRSGESDATKTRICTDTKGFLKTLDYALIGDAFSELPCLPIEQGSQLKLITCAPKNSIRLKNGVSVGIQCDEDNILVGIDTNQRTAIDNNKKPHTVGIDYFELQIDKVTDYANGKHAGDVGAFNDGDYEKVDPDKCKKDGDAKMCYRMVELSGFDPDYLNKDYSEKEN